MVIEAPVSKCDHLFSAFKITISVRKNPQKLEKSGSLIRHRVSSENMTYSSIAFVNWTVVNQKFGSSPCLCF
jgi:hypothetical protein